MKLKVTLLGMAVGVAAAGAQSPYISTVFEYRPAPGQFVNELPAYEEGDTEEDLRRKAEEYIAGQENGSLLSLGAWGGYVVVGFDHTIANADEGYDFKVCGNAFYAAANPNPDAPKGGSCEPGIVMVSRDTNGNGLPDDPWYELAGSEYARPATRHGYRVVYRRPDPARPAVPHPDDPNLTDTAYIAWHDNQGGSGYVERNLFHTQSYWPEWLEADSLVFEGTRLPDNGVDESGNRSYYVLYAYDWGYADNHPNTSDLCSFKIDWAVDSVGQPVHLPGIDFIKVYTGVLQMNGWLGECSTEISGITDLHPDLQPASGVASPSAAGWEVLSLPGGGWRVQTPCRARLTLYTPAGVPLANAVVEAGGNTLPGAHLPAGVYLLELRTDDGASRTLKAVKR